MVKPNVQTTAPSEALQRRSARVARTDGASTRSAILQAARRQLCEVGYARLNVRDIARAAGVNHALINYHFQGKQPLVLAVLDEANRELLERQTRMYSQATRASAQWRQACEFYDQDLQSGFVRLMMELMGASFNDASLRREFVPRLQAWHRVVETAVADTIERYELKLPVSAKAITGWIVSFWIGMEAHMTLGIADHEGHFREALKGMAELLRRVENGAAVPARAARSRK